MHSQHSPNRSRATVVGSVYFVGARRHDVWSGAVCSAPAEGSPVRPNGIAAQSTVSGSFTMTVTGQPFSPGATPCHFLAGVVTEWLAMPGVKIDVPHVKSDGCALGPLQPKRTFHAHLSTRDRGSHRCYSRSRLGAEKTVEEKEWD